MDAFVEGRLDADSRRQIESHVDACQSCGRLVIDLFGRISSVTSTLTRGPLASAGSADSDAFVEAKKGWREGDRIGRYVIIEGAGAGGMGTVYAAFDTVLNRKVALKILANGRRGSAIQRLLAEASAMAQLTHPNVVAVYDAGELGDEPFIAMELVEGVSLDVWRASQATAKPRRYFQEIARVMAGVARGLSAAHAVGIVHRDIKPANILVDGQRVLVTDFGLSVHERQVREGEAAGTPPYMAPEQWRGQQATGQTDVFGFCVTLYEMLTGVRPFRGRDANEMVAAIERAEIAPPPLGRKVPERLRKLAVSGLAADPRLRPAGLEHFVKVLSSDPSVRGRRIVIATVVLGAVASAFSLGAHMKSDPERKCRAAADALNRTFSEERQQRIAKHFRAAGLSSNWAPIERRLEEYAQQWQRLHEESCQAAFGKATQSSAVFDLRMSCLGRRKAAFETTLSLLEEGSQRQLNKAPGIKPPDLGECEFAANAGVKPLPTDPAQRGEAASINVQLGQSQAEYNLGDLDRSAERARAALVRARRLGYEPLVAQSLALLGVIEDIRGGAPGESVDQRAGLETRPAAWRMLEEAIVVAERGGADLNRAMSASELVMMYTNADRFREAELWGEIASSLLQRLGDPPHERASVLRNQGWLKLRLGDRPAAKLAFERAVELERRAHGDDDPEVISSRVEVCKAESSDEAQIACFRGTLPAVRRILGPTHPDLASHLNNLAVPLLAQRRTLSEACSVLTDARAILEANVENTNPALVATISNLATCLQRQGHERASRKLHEDVLVRASASASLLAGARQSLALALIASGDLPRAHSLLTEAIAAYRSIYGPRHENSLWPRGNLTYVLLRLNKPKQALDEISAVVATAKNLSDATTLLPWALELNGEVLMVLRRFTDARDAYQQALTKYAALGSSDADKSLALAGLGSAQVALGQREAGLRDLHVAREASGGDAVEPADRAEILRAWLLASAGGTSRRASADFCAAADEAVAAYRRAGSGYRSQELGIERLRRRHCRRVG